MTHFSILDRLEAEKQLPRADWITLFAEENEQDRAYAASRAHAIARARFGNVIGVRGIIEFTNICRNDCYYCGIRRSNGEIPRYRLTEEEILDCCAEGYAVGYRTFVLQGGEDAWWDDTRLCSVVRAIRAAYPECAITLSVGERSRESYQALFDAGANRYLLRHETASEAHYGKLHPPALSWRNRMRCLQDLKAIGYQTGCGCMVGSPYQTAENLADDMIFMGSFMPAMIGVGPFLPQHQTPFASMPAGSAETTLYVLSLCRILLPDVLLPATTALGTLASDGRTRGVLAGCNVVMPNLSPQAVRKKYMLYDHKIGTGDSASDGLRLLREQMDAIGYTLAAGRFDAPGYAERKSTNHA